MSVYWAHTSCKKSAKNKVLIMRKQGHIWTDRRMDRDEFIEPFRRAGVVLSVWKLLEVLQKPRMKIAARVFYTYQLFSLSMYFPVLLQNKVGVVIAVFFSKLDHRALFNSIDCETILVWGLVSIWLTNITHCLQYALCYLKYVKFH